MLFFFSEKTESMLQNVTLCINENTDLRQFDGIPFKKLRISGFEGSTIMRINTIESIEDVTLVQLELSNISILGTIPNLKSITLDHCTIKNSSSKLQFMEKLTNLSLLGPRTVSFLSLFTQQRNLKSITLENHDWTWNGFKHEHLNTILTAFPVERLCLIGNGTGSYFDFGFELPYNNLTTIDTSMITFHWYVGIRTERTNFLALHKGILKNLTIHELPYDFDGGRVLKYICDKMNLDKFVYKKTTLINNGSKVVEVGDTIEFTEIQITSAYEIVQQFKCIFIFLFSFHIKT